MNPPFRDKKAIRAWLKNHHRSNAWLAERCEVERKTVNNWLGSPRNIPKKAILIIQSLMEADAEAARAAYPAPPQNLILEVPPARFDAYNRASMARHMTIREWAVDSLNRAAATEPLPLNRAAETPLPYSAETRKELEEMADQVEPTEHPAHPDHTPSDPAQTAAPAPPPGD